jgi:preprotein translocase subunit SecB
VSELHAGPPAYDPASVGRLAGCVSINTIELLGAHFERADAGPLPATETTAEPEIGIDVRWAMEGEALGCVVTFGTLFPDDAPYELVAEFRVTYDVASVDPLDDDDVNQFAHWNAVFNVWPYWREYLASTLNRAGLPRFVAPVMRLPPPLDTSPV